MNKLTFKNGRFRILQLSDMQDTHRTSQDTINLTREIIATAKPDLIVLTAIRLRATAHILNSEIIRQMPQ